MILSDKELLPFKGLWHSIKQENINSILKNDFLESRTTQRWWENGKVFRDNQGSDYENSFYMKGWSMTRDRDYAFSWSCVTLLLDYQALKRDFKIQPISWNYRIGTAHQNFKKEREEFVISNFMKQTFEEIKNEYFELSDDIYDQQGEEAFKQWSNENGEGFIEYWQRKGLKNIELEKYLLGIFVSKESYDISSGRGFEEVLKHPLFKGFVSSDKSRNRHEKSMEKIKYTLT